MVAIPCVYTSNSHCLLLTYINLFEVSKFYNRINKNNLGNTIPKSYDT